MRKNLVAVFLLLSSTIACGQKKIDTVTLSNGKTIVIYDNKTWAYTNNEPKLLSKELTDTPRTNGTNNSGANNHSGGKSSSSSKSGYSSTCGAPTKKGGACQRKVSGGGRCWQH